MARTDNLTNYLTDIATAIKTKKGDETPINASKFDEEITNLPSGGGADEYFLDVAPTNNVFLINRCIKKLPIIDTSGKQNFTSAFQYYENIEEILELDTSSATTMVNAFDGCKKLKRLPEMNTANVTNMKYLFNRCEVLEQIPQLNTSNVTDMSYMCSYCYGITKLPQLDTSKVTTMTSMFNYCKKIYEVPALNGSKLTSIGSCFSNCSELTIFGGIINLGEAYPTTTSANFTNYTLTLSVCTKLTHDSLMNVINNLYDIKSKGCKTQKLVLGSTNLAKLTSDEIAIATNKGWTVS